MVASYRGIAEFHDLFMDVAWERLRPAIAATFGTLTDTHTIIDIGAGSGIGTRVIAAESVACIHAIEPALVMRSILTARVFDDPDLSRRVTIDADAAPAALSHISPGSASGFVAAHMLGHLDTAARTGMFAQLAQIVPPGGKGLATVSVPTRSETLHTAKTVIIGSRTYTERFVHDGGWVGEYSVTDQDGLVVRTARYPVSFQQVTAQDIAREAPDWTIDEIAPGVLTLTRQRR